jgi:hypothetical protein
MKKAVKLSGRLNVIVKGNYVIWQHVWGNNDNGDSEDVSFFGMCMSDKPFSRVPIKKD